MQDGEARIQVNWRTGRLVITARVADIARLDSEELANRVRSFIGSLNGK